MKVIDQGLVFAGEKRTNRQSCAFSGICALPGSRWVCTFRAAPFKIPMKGQHVLLTWSDDEGRTWSKPIAPFEPEPIDGRPGLFRYAHPTVLGKDHILMTLFWVDHSDPSLPLFNEKTNGLLDTRIFFSHSRDKGTIWSRPELMDTSPFNVPTPITGPALSLQNGDLACQFELNNHYYDTSVWRHSSVLMFSKDGGKSWPEYTIASNDPENRMYYWDQRPGILKDGRILNVFWTYDNKEAVYLNIHARESFDNGRTWSEMWDTGVPGQPAPPVSLPDGRVGMVYVDRTSSPIIKMRTSSDNGRTWEKKSETVIYKPELRSQTEEKTSMQDTLDEMYKYSVGLPYTALLQDGSLLVVYYAGPEADFTDIHWARLRA
jgi:hypothetical protein